MIDIDIFRLCMQLLWSSGAFVIGASRRTASYAPKAGSSASTRRLPYSDKLSVSANLLEDRITRDALFHLRCGATGSDGRVKWCASV